MKRKNEQSFTFERAAQILQIKNDDLLRICEQDLRGKYHHRAVYSGHIRFYVSEIERIKYHFLKTTKIYKNDERKNEQSKGEAKG